MRTEIEVKLLEINPAKIRRKLLSIGARKVKVRNMRRLVYDVPLPSHLKDKWLRLRDNGERTTLTIKEIKDASLEGTSELEITVDDFGKTKDLLEKIGFAPKMYQENKRESWLLGKTEIELDFWPLIPPYLEVEGKTKAAVERAVKLLGFAMKDATTENTRKVYARYGIEIEDYSELTFKRQRKFW